MQRANSLFCSYESERENPSQIHKIRLFLILNFYAFLVLFLIAFNLLFFFEYFCGNTFFLIIFAFLFFNLLALFFHIVSEFPKRKKLYAAVIMRNSNSLNMKPFEEHMKAPCYRIVCIEALKQSGFSSEIKFIKKKYPLFERIKIENRRKIF